MHNYTQRTPRELPLSGGSFWAICRTYDCLTTCSQSHQLCEPQQPLRRKLCIAQLHLLPDGRSRHLTFNNSTISHICQQTKPPRQRGAPAGFHVGARKLAHQIQKAGLLSLTQLYIDKTSPVLVRTVGGFYFIQLLRCHIQLFRETIPVFALHIQRGRRSVTLH